MTGLPATPSALEVIEMFPLAPVRDRAANVPDPVRVIMPVVEKSESPRIRVEAFGNVIVRVVAVVNPEIFHLRIFEVSEESNSDQLFDFQLFAPVQA